MLPKPSYHFVNVRQYKVEPASMQALQNKTTRILSQGPMPMCRQLIDFKGIRPLLHCCSMNGESVEGKESEEDALPSCWLLSRQQQQQQMAAARSWLLLLLYCSCSRTCHYVMMRGARDLTPAKPTSSLDVD